MKRQSFIKKEEDEDEDNDDDEDEDEALQIQLEASGCAPQSHGTSLPSPDIIIFMTWVFIILSKFL